MIALAQQSNILDEVIHGEALAVLRTLPDNSVDAIVCDPPAGISFMNKTFDSDRGGRDFWIAWLRKIMAEALRVLKPGGHAFVWALPRTSHWTGMALEDAGFEIRDCVNHFYDASTLMQQFLASLTSSQSDAFKALMDSQAVPSLVSHIFGSGFPKSADISKAIDKMQGAEREVVGNYGRSFRPHKDNGNEGWLRPSHEVHGDITAPATPEASQWNGWGTALKPASEHWWLCRKPLSEPTIAANVLKWGTGAINVDKCRVSHDEPLKPMKAQVHVNSIIQQSGRYEATTELKENGRWPANLLLSHSVWCVPNGVKRVHSNDRPNCIGKEYTNSSPAPMNRANDKLDTKAYTAPYADSEGMEQVEDWLCDESCPIRLLDEQSGMRVSKWGKSSKSGSEGFFNGGTRENDRYQGDQGGASRYFQRFSPFIYQAKASRAERNSGCEGLPESDMGTKVAPLLKCRLCGKWYPMPMRLERRPDSTCTCANPEYEKVAVNPSHNNHPCVKPLQLMRYLVRMITPPGGIVLDCFAGSGSTLVAAIHEGMHFIGIEQLDTPEEPYCTIARARIEQAFREVQ